MMHKTTIKISSEINPHYYNFWTSDRPYLVAKGGRGSFKSSVISIKLVVMMMKQIQQGHVANVVCIRENQAYIRDSVYNQILWAISLLHLGSKFRARTSPLIIEHIKSGSRFYFYGANDPLKLKSNLVGNVIALWYEEFANLKNADVYDQTTPTFIRQKAPYIDQVKVFFSYNPPKNPYSWINEWIEQKKTDPEYFIDSSTYLDDKLGFTTKQQLDLINQYKKNDPDYYRWLYLGEVIGLGTNVYNMDLFHFADKIPADEFITDMYYGMDVGFMHSATACVACAFTNKYNLYLVDTFYYDPTKYTRKKSPEEQAKAVHKFIGEVTDRYGVLPTNEVIDSADGGLYTQYGQMYGVWWDKVKKLTEDAMIDRVQDILAQGRFYVLRKPSNDVFIDEHKKYQWDPDTLKSDKPRVIKDFDHSVDAFKYLVLNNESDLGLSI